MEATFLPKFCGFDETTVKQSFHTKEERDLEIIVGLIYMPYDSVKAAGVEALLHRARENTLGLLLDCDANFHNVAGVQTGGKGMRDFTASD